jgi:hypothetical protein
MTATLQVDHAQEASDPGLTEVEMEMERKVNSHPTFNHSPYTDFEHVRRFLAARNRDVDAAYAMWEVSLVGATFCLCAPEPLWPVTNNRNGQHGTHLTNPKVSRRRKSGTCWRSGRSRCVWAFAPGLKS